MAYEVTKIDDRTWSILNEGFVRVFVLVGDKEALVIDTGANFPEIREVIGGLTDKPLKLVLTHADGDHRSGVKYFDAFHMHPAEAAFYYGGGPTGDYIAVNDGDVFDLGGRKIQVIHLPGHTHGSVGLLDLDSRYLFGGDGIQDGDIFMFGAYRDMEAYIESLKKLDAYRDKFDKVYASHGTLEVAPELIDKLCDAAKDVVRGEYSAVDGEMFDTSISICNLGFATFLLPRK